MEATDFVGAAGGDGESVVVKTWKGFKGDGASELNQETIAVRRFEVQPAKVSYWSSGKVNIGNYESVDIGVSISVPCYLEEADAAFKFAEKFVSDRLGKEINDVRAAVKVGEESKSKRGK